MRKKLLTAAVMTIVMLAGCGTGDNTREAELEKKVQQLEQQVTSLEQGNTVGIASASAGDNEIAAKGDNDTASQGDNGGTASGDVTIESLTEQVDTAVAAADGATPAGTDEEKIQQYFEIKSELDKADRVLDDYDNTLEDQYRSGTLSRDDYRTLERQLEALEDKLDNAEDKLEVVFGIDD